MTENISWEDLYAAAILELDRARLHGRIEAAQAVEFGTSSRQPGPVPGGGGDTMKRKCHEILAQTWRRRQLAVTELLHHAKVVTDPNTLEHLNARVTRRRADGDSRRARRQPVP